MKKEIKNTIEDEKIISSSLLAWLRDPLYCIPHDFEEASKIN